MIIDTIKEKAKILEIFNNNLDFKNQWENSFLNNLSTQEKTKAYIKNFLWHSCSYNKIAHISGKEAITLFDLKEKKDIIIFYEENNTAFLLRSIKNFTYLDFKTEKDIYISDINFTWTFVITHEKICGPYFIEKK